MKLIMWRSTPKTSGSLVAGMHRRRNRSDETFAGTVKQRFYGTVYGVRRRTNALECALIRASARRSARANAYACVHVRALFGRRKTDHSWCYTVHAGHECTIHVHTHARARVRARVCACAGALSRYVPQPYVMTT